MRADLFGPYATATSLIAGVDIGWSGVRLCPGVGSPEETNDLLAGVWDLLTGSAGHPLGMCRKLRVLPSRFLLWQG